ATAVTQSSHVGLKDPDPQVRGSCLEAMSAAANALADLIDSISSKESLSKKIFPPPGRKLTDEEKKDIQTKNDQVRKELLYLDKLIFSLRDQGSAMYAALGDDDFRVRLSALNALENLANIRVRMQRLMDTVPPIAGQPRPDDGLDPRQL